MNLDGSGIETIASGVRNTVGFDFDPKTGNLWFTDNGRDWLSEELPNDELNHVDAARQAALRLSVLPPGQHPRSGIRLGQVVRRLRQARRAARAARRLARPEVLHRQDVPGEVPGRDVHRPPRPVEPHQEVRRRLGRLARRQGRRRVEPFMTGFVENNSYLGRPVDFLVMKDGSLLVSDDHAGAIYRISYAASDGEEAGSPRGILRRAGADGRWPHAAGAQHEAAQATGTAASAPAAAGDPTPQRFATVCAACHGANGRSDMPGTPVLAGQHSFYAITQLFLFREGRRSNEAMTAVAKTMKDDDLRGFSEFIGTLPPVPAPAPATPPDAARMSKGARARAAAQVRVLPRRRPRRRPAGAAHRRPARGLPADEPAGLQVGQAPGLHDGDDRGR